MRSIEDTTPYRPVPSPAAIAVAGADALPHSRRKFSRPFFSELWRWALTLAIFLPLAGALAGTALIVAIYLQARSNQTRQVDAIVVLGAAQYNGRPSPILQARLDEAIDAYEEGVAPVIVVTGGRQAGDQFTEAEASRDYLVEHGVPVESILLENEAHNSWESMKGTAALLEERGLDEVLLVSDGFHLFRVKMMARELGLEPYGRPAETSPIARSSGREFSYVIREAGGVIAHLLDR